MPTSGVSDIVTIEIGLAALALGLWVSFSRTCRDFNIDLFVGKHWILRARVVAKTERAPVGSGGSPILPGAFEFCGPLPVSRKAPARQRVPSNTNVIATKILAEGKNRN